MPNAEMEPAALLAAFMSDLAAGRVQTGDGVAPIATCWLDAWRMAQAEAPRPRVASARHCLRHHHHPTHAEAIGEHAERRGEEGLPDRHLDLAAIGQRIEARSEEHTSELQSLMRNSY